jgi:hypothetical protein
MSRQSRIDQQRIVIELAEMNLLRMQLNNKQQQHYYNRNDWPGRHDRFLVLLVRIRQQMY